MDKYLEELGTRNRAGLESVAEANEGIVRGGYEYVGMAVQRFLKGVDLDSYVRPSIRVDLDGRVYLEQGDSYSVEVVPDQPDVDKDIPLDSNELDSSGVFMRLIISGLGRARKLGSKVRRVCLYGEDSSRSRTSFARAQSEGYGDALTAANLLGTRGIGVKINGDDLGVTRVKAEIFNTNQSAYAALE